MWTSLGSTVPPPQLSPHKGRADHHGVEGEGGDKAQGSGRAGQGLAPPVLPTPHPRSGRWSPRQRPALGPFTPCQPPGQGLGPGTWPSLSNSRPGPEPSSQSGFKVLESSKNYGGRGRSTRESVSGALCHLIRPPSFQTHCSRPPGQALAAAVRGRGAMPWGSCNWRGKCFGDRNCLRDKASYGASSGTEGLFSRRDSIRSWRSGGSGSLWNKPIASPRV